MIKKTLKSSVNIKNYENENIFSFHTSTFIQNHIHPIILVKHRNFANEIIVYTNHTFQLTFSKSTQSNINFTSFISEFTFLSEPVKILASEEKIKAFHKKTEYFYSISTQPSDSEHVFIEFIPQIETSMSNEKQLSESQRYKELLNLLPETIFELNNDFTFRFLNEAALQIFGLSQNDLKSGIHVEKIIVKKEYTRFKKYLSSIFEGKKLKVKVIPVVSADGKITLLEIYFTLIRHGVKITGIRGIGIDITHRKKIEEKLIQAKEQIEQADKLKTSFLMNMSHEIRTPLNSVLGYTQLLQRKVQDPQLKEFLQNIKSSGKGLLNLFNDLIDLSKIYAEQLDIIPTECNLNKTLDLLTRDFNTDIFLKKKDIELRAIKGLEDNDSYINIDDDRLKQVFTSLFNNSLFFTNSGYIEFGYQLINSNLHFFMKDSGEGIHKKYQKRVFEFFYQPESMKGEQKRGTGIGLAITRGIIQKMNGKIWVESEKGKGTLFNFILPYEPVIEMPENTGKNTRKISGLENKEILIVEDDSDNFFILNSFLVNTKAKITHVTNGIEAIEAAEKKKYDVIFMDINIPGIDGSEATKIIRSKNKDVIIIAQSAYVLKEDKIKCYQAGCDAFIEKPIYGEILLSTLSGFISKQG